LAWLGIQTWRAPSLLTITPDVEHASSSIWSLARQEFLLAGSNPKAPESELDRGLLRLGYFRLIPKDNDVLDVLEARSGCKEKRCDKAHF
jgi:hypothetical protein